MMDINCCVKVMVSGKRCMGWVLGS